MQDYCDKFNVKYHTYCSAKNNVNITDTFEAFYKGNFLVIVDVYNKEKPSLIEKSKNYKDLMKRKKPEISKGDKCC